MVRTRIAVALTVWLLAGVGIVAGNSGAVQAQTQAASVKDVLAPTGKLRVGVYLGSPTSMVKSGTETHGLAHDLGQEVAARIGVAFEPVVFARIAEVIEAMQAERVDFTVTNATPARAKVVDFTPTVLSLELGYLVPAGSPILTIADIDKAGNRIGVTKGSTSERSLPKLLPSASVVAAPSVKEAARMLADKQLDAFATNKAILFEMADGLAGAKVLDGRWGVEHMAIAIPKGRESGLQHLSAFAEELRKTGIIARMIEQAGLRGAVSSE
jgi:polar amino acid transport system substrate-binding protein